MLTHFNFSCPMNICQVFLCSTEQITTELVWKRSRGRVKAQEGLWQVCRSKRHPVCACVIGGVQQELLQETQLSNCKVLLCVALQEGVQCKHQTLIHHFGRSKVCWKLNGTTTVWQVTNWSAKRTREFLKIAPVMSGEGTGAVCRLSACYVLCYHRWGSNDKYHLW